MNIAIYLRVSKEDALSCEESSSISCQRLLLKEYISKHFEDYELLEFADDGYSGTNLDRPAMRALLACVRARKADCIVVKDFSRFARDYVEAGSYVEQIFPFLGVRFISVNDGYDSGDVRGKTGGMERAFQNLMNDLYSKDLSVKVKSSLHAKKERGVYCSGNCPFGYKKKEGGRNQVEIVEEEAELVRRIFRLTLEGYTSVEIAKKLNQENIKAPIEYLMARGAARRKPVGKGFSWEGSTVCTMLRNDFYAGDVVYGKYERETVGGKPRLKPRNEWRITYDHHEPIVARKVFEEVQRIRGERKPRSLQKTHSGGAAHVLQGKVLCAECGRALRYRNAKKPYFYCGSRYSTGNENCLERVYVCVLEQTILSALQKEIGRQTEIGDVRKYYEEASTSRCRAERKKRDKLQGQLACIVGKKAKTYERYKSGQLSGNEYKTARSALQRREELLKSELQQQEQLCGRMETELYAEASDDTILRNACGIRKLNRWVTEVFVRKLSVRNTGQIELLWNFCGSREAAR